MSDYSGSPPNFLPEMGAFDRIGDDDLNLPPIIGPGGGSQDPLDRFRLKVNAISYNLKDYNVPISKNDISVMLEKAGNLDKVKYKNPSAYVLGYIASSGGRNITRDSVNKTSKYIPHLQEGSVLPPDIVRYARLWVNLNA
jgi:hypothetical protein